MKKYILLTAVLFLALSFSSGVFAQKTDKYVPEKGHWQLVSNIHDRKTVTVQFYTEEGTMFYEEKLTGVKMNLERKKVRKQLYYAMKEAYTEWTKTAAVNNKNLIAKRN